MGQILSQGKNGERKGDEGERGREDLENWANLQGGENSRCANEATRGKGGDGEDCAPDGEGEEENGRREIINEADYTQLDVSPQNTPTYVHLQDCRYVSVGGSMNFTPGSTKERRRDLDELAEEVRNIRERTIEEIEEFTDEMIRVSAIEDVIEKLQSSQWVTITGNAGDGKTTLGFLVLKEFLQNNEMVFCVRKPEEYDHIEKLREDRLIMLDDRFGAFLADQQLIKNWWDVIVKLLSYTEKKKSKTKVIFLSRKNVVNEARVHLGRFADQIMDPESLVDLSKRKVTRDRLEILDYHLQRENVTIACEVKERVANMDIAHGFPHCSKMFSKLKSKGYDIDIKEFFESPLKFLDMTTKVLYNDYCKDLFQLLIKNDGEFNVHNIPNENRRHALLKVEKEQEGSYITVWRNGVCRFAHPSIYESTLKVINDIDPLFSAEHASLSVLRQKMVMSISEEVDKHRDPCYIIVKPIPTVLKALAERFTDDIVKGDYSVFTHTLCESREFSDELVSCCVTTNGEFHDFKQNIETLGREGWTMLWTALRGGKMAAVCSLVRKGASINRPDHRGKTPLHYLCWYRPSPDDPLQDKYQEEAIRLSISEGSGDFNRGDDNGNTPFHHLCKRPDIGEDILKMVIDASGDVNKGNIYGTTPFHYLCMRRNTRSDILKVIIDEGQGDLNHGEQNMATPLHYLCAYSGNDLTSLDLVITEGQGDLSRTDEHGSTPLHHLCGNRNITLDVIIGIIKLGVGDMNKEDNNKSTPLHVLCRRSLPLKDILEVIKQGKGDIKHADLFGNTPIHHLCRREDVDAGAVEDLKQIDGIDLVLKNMHGYTALDYLMNLDCLPWTDSILDRDPDDLVVCREKNQDKIVLGPAMSLSSEDIGTHKNLQVEDGELSNIKKKLTNKLKRFNNFLGACSNPFQSPFSNSNPVYWESHTIVTWKKEPMFPLLEMGVVEGGDNLCIGAGCLSDIPRSVCVSVSHHRRFGIRVLSTAGEQKKHGETIHLPLPSNGDELKFKFGLVMDVWRGRVAFIDVEREKLLCKVDQTFTQDVFPTFFIDPENDNCATRMRPVVSGRDICITEQKVRLIQQALSD